MNASLNSKGMCCGYSDQSAWLSLNDALDAAASPEVGLGISLAQERLGLMASGQHGYLYYFDFYGFLDLGGATVDEVVLELLKRLSTYCEVSPSRTGFKVFLLKGMKPTDLYGVFPMTLEVKFVR